MGEIVNLRRVRKSKARQERQADAEANRLRHGETKAGRAATARFKEHTDARLEAHRRDDGAR